MAPRNLLDGIGPNLRRRRLHAISKLGPHDAVIGMSVDIARSGRVLVVLKVCG
jgi:hypothetical protein